MVLSDMDRGILEALLMALSDMDRGILEALLMARRRGLEDGAVACDEMVKVAEKINTPPTAAGKIIVDTLKMAADGVRKFPQPLLEELIAQKENAQ